MENELCSRHYPLKDRLRLFSAVITPTALFGSKAWVLNAERERKLRSTQRRMLMVGLRRYVLPETNDSTDNVSTELTKVDEQAEDEHEEDVFAEGQES